jgi:hypothetical protein
MRYFLIRAIERVLSTMLIALAVRIVEKELHQIW